MSEPFLSDQEWDSLLIHIHAGGVIPVVGPALVTIPDAESGVDVPFDHYLAPKLAKALGLEANGQPLTKLNDVACRHLLSDGSSSDIYTRVFELLGNVDAAPSQALLSLASITDFDLYISTTIDSMLSAALDEKRGGFQPKEHVAAYSYTRVKDVPKGIDDAFHYQILGNADTFPHFAVWEEDYMAFLHGLIKHQDQLPNLSNLLSDRFLLLLGAPFDDWAVRFFLFVANGGERFSSQKRNEVKRYLTDRPENLAEPLVFFFNTVVGTTRVIEGSPVDFTNELARRWRAKYHPQADRDVFAEMPEEMPRDSVFVSYSRDDEQAVRRLVTGLLEARVPVWLDRQRLQLGDNYRRELEYAIKHECSFFISVISNATESDPRRFVHQERRWAAENHVDGFVFYLPVVIDDEIVQPKAEPGKFKDLLHLDQLPGGAVNKGFTNRLRKLLAEFRDSGRPRA